jgi:hypothetical protein
MTLHRNARHGAEALSHQVKAGVVPIEKPAKREKSPSCLSRKSQMERRPSKLKHTPLGHTTDEQKLRVADKVCIVCGKWLNACDPAHVVPGGHPKMSDVAADDVRAVVPLCRHDHNRFDDGENDLTPYLEPAWRDAQEWAAGAVGLASALRSISGERAG